MTKVAKFSPDNLNAIREAMETALATVEAKFGIKIGIGKMSYTENDFTTKLTTMIANEAVATSNADPKWISDFMRNCTYFGLTKDDLGRTIKHNGKTLKLVGSRCRAAKPLVVEEFGTGKFMIFTVEAFKKALV